MCEYIYESPRIFLILNNDFLNNETLKRRADIFYIYILIKICILINWNINNLFFKEMENSYEIS